jgi:hypothetical protein
MLSETSRMTFLVVILRGREDRVCPALRFDHW